MPYLQVGPTRVYWRELGLLAKPPVVFIHGAGGNGQLWGSQLRSLSAIRHVLSLDLPGHGRSSGTGMAYMGDYAAVAAAVLTRLATPAIVVGHSMGGGVALQLALRWPELLAGMVLVGTGSRLRVSPAILNGLQVDFPAAVAAITKAAFAPDTASGIRKRGEASLLGTGPATLLADFQACDSFDVMQRLGEIRIPCLVLCGAEDRMTPLKYSEALASGIQGARLAIIPAAGHMVMLEQPVAVTEAIRTFVSER